MAEHYLFGLVGIQTGYIITTNYGIFMCKCKSVTHTDDAFTFAQAVLVEIKLVNLLVKHNSFTEFL